MNDRSITSLKINLYIKDREKVYHFVDSDLIFFFNVYHL